MSDTPQRPPSPDPSSLFPLPCSLPQWCVVLPAYNEEDNLTHVVDDVLATF